MCAAELSGQSRRCGGGCSGPAERDAAESHGEQRNQGEFSATAHMPDFTGNGPRHAGERRPDNGKPRHDGGERKQRSRRAVRSGQKIPRRSEKMEIEDQVEGPSERRIGGPVRKLCDQDRGEQNDDGDTKRRPQEAARKR